MPNWCDNKLVITGKPETLDKIINSVMGEVNGDTLVFDFRKIAPEPEFENDTDWYHWRLKNWGTKWNADTPYIVEDSDEDTLIYDFYTAWGPSEALTQKLSEKFPDVHITHWYEEGGMDFSGYSVFHGGNVLHSVSGDFNAYWRYYTDDDELLDRHI